MIEMEKSTEKQHNHILWRSFAYMFTKKCTDTDTLTVIHKLGHSSLIKDSGCELPWGLNSGLLTQRSRGKKYYSCSLSLTHKNPFITDFM